MPLLACKVFKNFNWLIKRSYKSQQVRYLTSYRWFLRHSLCLQRSTAICTLCAVPSLPLLWLWNDSLALAIVSSADGVHESLKWLPYISQSYIDEQHLSQQSGSIGVDCLAHQQPLSFVLLWLSCAVALWSRVDIVRFNLYTSALSTLWLVYWQYHWRLNSNYCAFISHYGHCFWGAFFKCAPLFLQLADRIPLTSLLSVVG